jgi:hypothetical protein
VTLSSKGDFSEGGGKKYGPHQLEDVQIKVGSKIVERSQAPSIKGRGSHANARRTI